MNYGWNRAGSLHVDVSAITKDIGNKIQNRVLRFSQSWLSQVEFQTLLRKMESIVRQKAHSIFGIHFSVNTLGPLVHSRDGFSELAKSWLKSKQHQSALHDDRCKMALLYQHHLTVRCSVAVMSSATTSQGVPYILKGDPLHVCWRRCECSWRIVS